MKIIVSQINPTIGDICANTKKVIECIDLAIKQDVDLILFPELTLCGYPPEDLVLHESFINSMHEHLEQVVKVSKNIVVVVGLVRKNTSHGEKPLLNSACIIQDQKIIGFYEKWLLPTYDVFDERRYFEPGKTLFTFNLQGKKIGITICEDVWQHAGYVDRTKYPRDPIVELSKENIDLLLNLSASPYRFTKSDLRVEVCQKAARTLQAPVILCCQVGANTQIVFDGYSVFVDEKGDLRSLGKGFEEDQMLVDLQNPSPVLTKKKETLEDLYKALVLGVRDYFHKLGFTKACLGLSGGIDSALVCCIAREALGSQNIFAISMPSKYTSKQSKIDAEKLADNLGISFEEDCIDSLFTCFLENLSPFFKEKKGDVTEENLQARIRGMILMALSNKHGYITLSCSNKSEAALGYTTLYGDSCGGLGVIGDVLKTDVYRLCRWINREKEIIPSSILEKAPSAELRLDQKDTDTLPDYAILDKILMEYVENYLSMDEIIEKHNLPKELVWDIIRKIHLSEYKRRQSPPILRISKKAFGVGRRYPIVQNWL